MASVEEYFAHDLGVEYLLVENAVVENDDDVSRSPLGALLLLAIHDVLESFRVERVVYEATREAAHVARRGRRGRTEDDEGVDFSPHVVTEIEEKRRLACITLRAYKNGGVWRDGAWFEPFQ